jgi:hypothetical protein
VRALPTRISPDRNSERSFRANLPRWRVGHRRDFVSLGFVAPADPVSTAQVSGQGNARHEHRVFDGLRRIIDPPHHIRITVKQAMFLGEVYGHLARRAAKKLLFSSTERHILSAGVVHDDLKADRM